MNEETFKPAFDKFIRKWVENTKYNQWAGNCTHSVVVSSEPLQFQHIFGMEFIEELKNRGYIVDYVLKVKENVFRYGIVKLTLAEKLKSHIAMMNL